MLEHKYTEANLKMDHLKGKDRMRALSLQRACQERGFSFLLANMVHEVMGGCEEDSDQEFHEIEDEVERSLKLKVLVDANGSVMARDVPFEEENILQPEPFDRDPDDEDYSGWTGNEGVSATHWFRDSCIVVMSDPEKVLEDITFKNALSSWKYKSFLNSLMDDLRKAECQKTHVASNPDVDRCKRRLLRYCTDFASQQTRSSYLDNYGVDDFAFATVLLDCPDLFEKIASINYRLANFQPPTYRNIGSALAFELSEPAKWQRSISLVLKKSERSLLGVWNALCAVREGFKSSLSRGSSGSTPGEESISLDSLNGWIHTTLNECLTGLSNLDARDGETLIKIAQESPDCERFLFRTMLPFIKRHISKKDFVLATLRTFYQLSQGGHVPEKVAVNLYRDVLSDIGPDLLKVQETGNSSKKRFASHYPPPRMAEVQHAKGPRIDVKPTDLATLCSHALKLGLNKDVQKILQDIVSKSGQLDVNLFENSWIPFLQKLLPTVNVLPVEGSKKYRPFFQGVIDNYVRRHLIKEPPQPTNTSPTKLGCGACEACRELDRFLADPKMEVGTFARTAPIRKHLEMRIGKHYKTSVEKYGSPHRLLVHKRYDVYRAYRALEDFKERRAQVAKDIKSIGVEGLNKLLGTSHNELISFDSPRNKELVAGGPARAPLTSFAEHIATNRTNQPGLEIVDLTK